MLCYQQNNSFASAVLNRFNTFHLNIQELLTLNSTRTSNCACKTGKVRKSCNYKHMNSIKLKQLNTFNDEQNKPSWYRTKTAIVNRAYFINIKLVFIMYFNPSIVTHVRYNNNVPRIIAHKAVPYYCIACRPLQKITVVDNFY